MVCGAIVGVGRDDEELASARAGVTALLGFYGSTLAYQRVLASIDRAEVHEPLRALVRDGRFGELDRLVDDEMVDRLSIVGRPDEVAGRVIERFGWVADRLSLFIPSDPSSETLRALFTELHGASAN